MGPREVMRVVGVLVVIALTPEPATSTESCLDGDPRCPGLAVVGFCSSNSVYMKRVCPYSCNLCVAAEDSRDTYQSDEVHLEQLPTSTAVPETAQETTMKPRRTIVDPDFACGGPPTLSTRYSSQSPAQSLQQENSGIAFQASETEGRTQPIEHSSCGASVISDRFIVTAAYCVLGKNVTSVRLGDIDLAQDNETNSNPADYDIIDIFLPPGFNEGVLYDDIALLKTDRKIEFNDAVFPYCVSPSPPPAGTEVIVAGFGFINETHKTTQLMEATLEVLPLANCEERYLNEEEQRLRKAYPSLLQGRPGLLCAGDKISGVCRGDEGGPLFRESEDGRRYLEGLISFTGSFCGDGVLPGIFTSLADYVDFIDEIIYGNENL